MNLLLISDIHSNAFALERVLEEASHMAWNYLVLLGDTFGYYPWAKDTWALLKPLVGNTIAILGNHDKLLLMNRSPSPQPSYWQAALQNRDELEREAPDALAWLKKRLLMFSGVVGGWNVTCCHGTPEDPLNGRFYPDQTDEASWFPGVNHLLLLGHTHYPLYRVTSAGGIIINPGSVGQPRDGDPRAAWAILDTNTGKVVFHRTFYNHLYCMELLHSMGWDERTVRALNKTSSGAMN